MEFGWWCWCPFALLFIMVLYHSFMNRINTPGGPVLRNASSLAANNKVVDSSLVDYLKNVPGIVVLRPVQ